MLNDLSEFYICKGLQDPDPQCIWKHIHPYVIFLRADHGERYNYLQMQLRKSRGLWICNVLKGNQIV